MNEEKPPLRESGIRWLWVSLLAIALDQLTKLWIVEAVPFREFIYVLPVFDITHTYNPGMAFSWLANWGGGRWLLTVVAIGVSVLLLSWLRSLKLAAHRMLVFGLALILGGAIGNVIDRVRLGHVVDFLHFHWGNASFPSFNVADSCICVGAAFVLLDAVSEWRQARQAKKAALQVEGGGGR